MSTEPKSLFQRAGPTQLMYWMGYYLPPVLGWVLVWVMTGLTILFQPPVYDAAYQNLRHVLPPDIPRLRLRLALWRLLYYRAKGYYDFFHNVGRERRVDRFHPPVRISAEVHRYFNEAVFSGRGLLVLGTHTSNYDLCGCALAEYLPVPPLVLSIADPAPGLQYINALRRRGRGLIAPVSAATLRDAVRRLRDGGIVMTGVDRPLAEGNAPVTLFGAQALLPTGYIRMPLLTDCLVMTIACRYDGEAYHIFGNPPMAMLRTGSRAQDEAVNLERVLVEVEGFVREAPDQWMVFVPVWPDKKDQMGAYAQT